MFGGAEKPRKAALTGIDGGGACFELLAVELLEGKICINHSKKQMFPS